MGTPTQRRHSSIRIRMPTTPMTTWTVSIRVDRRTSVIAFSAK